MFRQSQNPWLNIIEYPFATREYEYKEGWLSFVDEGRGHALLFVHGSPSWSYLFRKVIKALRESYRCIAPDLLGFGLSDKPEKADYSPAAHSERLEMLCDYLGLESVTLVLHDIGGPIGLGLAQRRPERVRDIVLFNTWMWSLHANRPAQRLANLIGNPINRFYYRVLNASPTFIMPALFADRHRIPKSTQIQYLEPFRKFKERRGIYSMVESLKTGKVYYESLWERRSVLEEKRFLFLWGMKDPLYGPDALARWCETYPKHSAVEFNGMGRFVPEEGASVAADEIRWFLMNHVGTATGVR